MTRRDRTIAGSDARAGIDRRTLAGRTGAARARGGGARRGGTLRAGARASPTASAARGWRSAAARRSTSRSISPRPSASSRSSTSTRKRATSPTGRRSSTRSRSCTRSPMRFADARVRIMTLHRAKGLEFDTVILPGLARVPNRGDDRDPALAPPAARAAARADEGARRRSGSDLRVSRAPRGRRGSRRARPAALRRLHAREAAIASHRGARARRRCRRPPAWRKPPGGSALAEFWPALEATVAPPARCAPDRFAARRRERPLRRLPVDWRAPEPPPGVPARASTTAARDELPFDWARETAKHVGTIAHRLFAQIARDGIAAWDAARVDSLAPRLSSELAAAGVDESELAGAVTQAIEAVRRLLADPRGRWCFDPGHAEAMSEWALAGWDGSAIAHVTIDRTFVAEGERWIVDFKTGTHEGADREAFPRPRAGALSRPARALCGVRARARCAPDPARPLPSAAGRLARMGVRRRGVVPGSGRKIG